MYTNTLNSTLLLALHIDLGTEILLITHRAVLYLLINTKLIEFLKFCYTN